MGDFEKLADLWRKKCGRRAGGGERALLGFYYQLMVTLEFALREFLSNPNEWISITSEKISDTSRETTDGNIIFTQVKRTGRSISKALSELWSIHCVACDNVPDLVKHLQYDILCSEWTLKDIPRALVRWHPNGTVDESRLFQFKKQVSCKIQADPLQDILALVAHELRPKNPLETVYKWLGLLFQSREALQQISWDMWSLYKRSAHEWTAGMHVWSSEDHPPICVIPGQISVLNQPKLSHFKDGCFTERALYSKLVESCISLIIKIGNNTEGNRKIPILWLEGPWCSGKSVAFLYILRGLFLEGVGPLLWLSSNVDLLSEAIARGSSLGSEDNQVVIAVDEPYLPRNQDAHKHWTKALRELEHGHNVRSSRSPIILCCGPTNQRFHFRRDFAESVTVHSLTVPGKVTDRHHLSNFFEERTGEKVKHVEGRDLPIGHMFFEWREDTPIDEFAERLRVRAMELEGGDRLIEVLSRILALNRLNTGYPRQALKEHLEPSQRDSFGVLSEELGLKVDEEPDKAGAWLGHASIFNAIFECWYPIQGSSNQRRDILRAAILDQLKFGLSPQDQTAALWILSRHSDEDRRAGDVEIENRSNLVIDIYRDWCDTHLVTLDLYHLSAWISIQFSGLGERLCPDPLDKALLSIIPENIDMTGFRLICHILLKHYYHMTSGQQQQLCDLLVTLLEAVPDWSEWDVVAVDAIEHLDDPRLWDAIRRRLEKNNNDSFYLIVKMLGSGTPRIGISPLVDISTSWLKRNLLTPEAGTLLSSLLSRKDLGQSRINVSTIALNWLESFENPRMVTQEQVLRGLIAVRNSDTVTIKAVRLVLDILKNRELLLSDSFLLAGVLRSRTILTIRRVAKDGDQLAEDVIGLAVTWLKRYSTCGNASYVMDRLLRLDSVTDDHWKMIAEASLKSIPGHIFRDDVDHSFLSITCRLHLLSKDQLGQFSTLVRKWSEHVLEEKRFRGAYRQLAPALALLQIVDDPALIRVAEERARTILRGPNRAIAQAFRADLWTLYRSHAWKDPSVALRTFEKIGLLDLEEGEKREFLKHLTWLCGVACEAIRSRMVTAVDRGLSMTDDLLEAEDFEFAGYFLAKMLPIASRLNKDYLAEVEQQASQLLGLKASIISQFAFMRECDILVERNTWPSHELAYQSFARIGNVTPGYLRKMCLSKQLGSANIERGLDFVEECAEQLLLRTGLFLPFLIPLAVRLCDRVITDRCLSATRYFLDSTSISEAYKVGFAEQLRSAIGSEIPGWLRELLDARGLIYPWIISLVDSQPNTEEEHIIEFLKKAEKLIEEEAFARAGKSLAQLMTIVHRFDTNQQVTAVEKVAHILLSHPGLSPQQRDGFAGELARLSWPSLAIQDETFQKLGIGCPGLARLLTNKEEQVTIEILERSLAWAETHLQNGRLIGAYHILGVALPLSSRVVNSKIRTRTLLLVEDLMNSQNLNESLVGKFKELCLRNYHGGYWSDLDFAKTSLGRLGLRVE